MRALLSLSTLLPLLACAGDPATQAGPVDQQAASDMVCTREYPTGSNIPITKCRTREQVEEERRSGREALSRRQTGGPKDGIDSGGN